MLPKPIWMEGEQVFLIDQTKLPAELDVIEIRTEEQMWDAIKRLVVRGAPAIGLAGAFGKTGLFGCAEHFADAGGLPADHRNAVKIHPLPIGQCH